MKKYTVLCAAVGAALLLTGCKSSQEAAYKQAYLKDKQQEIVDKAIEERAEELRKEARAEVEEKLKGYEEDIKDNEEEIERLTKKLQNAENDDFARFRAQANILQNAFNDCLGAIDSTSVTNKDGAEAMKAALRKILNMELDTLT